MVIGLIWGTVTVVKGLANTKDQLTDHLAVRYGNNPYYGDISDLDLHPIK
jgi:hypothetical protein